MRPRGGPGKSLNSSLDGSCSRPKSHHTIRGCGAKTDGPPPLPRRQLYSSPTTFTAHNGKQGTLAVSHPLPAPSNGDDSFHSAPDTKLNYPAGRYVSGTSPEGGKGERQERGGGKGGGLQLQKKKKKKKRTSPLSPRVRALAPLETTR